MSVGVRGCPWVFVGVRGGFSRTRTLLYAYCAMHFIELWTGSSCTYKGLITNSLFGSASFFVQFGKTTGLINCSIRSEELQMGKISGFKAILSAFCNFRLQISSLLNFASWGTELLGFQSLLSYLKKFASSWHSPNLRSEAS